ncbi:MAG: DUF5320 domain-containing protein [Candidatus Omnitrophota bacterium]
MPGYDGTGPRGMGSMTGGGRGYCAMPVGSFDGRPRIGRLSARGGGRGWRNRYYATGLMGWQRSGFTAEEEKEALSSEAELLQQELSDIQSRISALEKDKEQKENQ